MKLLVLAGITVLALFSNSSAHATSGDAMPSVTEAAVSDAQGACGVVGQVTTPAPTTGAPGQEVGHSEYTFLSTVLICQAVLGDASLSGTWNVTANGASWGPIQPGFCSPTSNPPGSGGAGVCEGSATAASWSDGRLYTSPCGGSPTNKGNLTATSPAGTSNAFVKFVRLGSETVAWGSFCDGPLSGLSFTANLEFTPSGAANVYDLRGAAVIH